MIWFGAREGTVERRGKKKDKISNKTPPSFLSLINRGNYTPSRWRNR